ncbi:N-acetylglucosamine kinase [Streptacidiphilus sp. PAMC 29251]
MSQAFSVLGIDVGATKTHLATARDGVVVSEQIIRTTGWRTRSPETDAAALAALLRDAFGEDALRRPLAVGAHGCDSTEQCLVLERALARHTAGPVRVVNDAELMPWSMGVAGGIGVVSGTGAIAVARDARQRLLTAGGWGWILGDEGGASGIVREAVRAVLAELDADRTGDRLTVRLLGSLGAGDGPELAMALSLDSSADIWGSHAGEVFAAADEGSPVALRVIDRAGAHLAQLVQQLLARGVSADRVVAGGAVIAAQPRLHRRFLTVLHRTSPELSVDVVDRPPVLGALALAAALPAEPLTPEAAP